MHRLLAASITLLPASALAATPDEEGRIELVTYAALYGAALGVWSAVELDLSARPAAWLAAGLAGGALWGTWEAAEARGLDAGQSALVASAGAWAAADALALGLIGGAKEQSLWLAFGAGALGAGAAFAAAPYFTGGPGDVSLVNSGGIWVPVAGSILAATLDFDAFDDVAIEVVLAMNLLGLAGGVALATQYDPSREQVLYLDLGILAGGLGGGLLGVMGAVMTESVEVGGLLAVGGMVAGGVIAVQTVGFDGGRAKAARPAAPVVMPLWAGSW
ncbi:MAG: hypothetical protein H6703_05520 [Myxococcales bacterium]|nr:hypothetical protein [Myxococcales bacterium]MCB9552939.1 hypothetical protein [Myxococcales bacterium]